MMVEKKRWKWVSWGAAVLTAVLWCGAPSRSQAADKPVPATEKPAAKLDLNSASVTDLEDLPGVGDVTAKKIVDNRPYKTVDELSKAGLSAKKIEKIAPLVTINGKASVATPATLKPTAPTVAAAGKPEPAIPAGPAAKVDLNTATAEQLEELPGIGEATSKKIIANRPYTSPQDLSKAGLSAAKITKLEPLVVVAATPSVAVKPTVPDKIHKPEMGTKPETVKPDTAKPDTAKPAVATGGKIDLNTATDKELEELPGVGAATAKKIIAGRPYTKMEDLTKAGVSAKTVEKFADKVTIGASAVAPTPATPTVTKPTVSTPTATVDPKTTPEPKAGNETLTPPVKGMVWVNTDSGIYHKEGDRWYGKTKNGKFLSEDDAKKAGFREAK